MNSSRHGTNAKPTTVGATTVGADSSANILQVIDFTPQFADKSAVAGHLARTPPGRPARDAFCSRQNAPKECCTRATGIRRLLMFAILSLATFFAQTVTASQFERFGDLDVHYIVFNTTDLSPEMAERYGLTRSPDLGLINISGRRLAEDGTTTPVKLALEGRVTNLLGQNQRLSFSEVEDPAAVYYLETVRFTDRETLRFDVQVTDTETGRRHSIQFHKALWRQ